MPSLLYRLFSLIFLITFTITLLFEYEIVHEIGKVTNSFDLRQDFLDLGAVGPILNDTISGSISTGVIRGEFLSSIKPTDYQNIFQTDEVNAGIRMEISSSGNAGIVIGQDAQFVGLEFPEPIRLNEWNIFSIQILEKNIIATLNNNSQSVDLKVEPHLSKVKIGTGFSGTRPFSGSIRNFIFDLKIDSAGETLSHYLWLIRFTLFIGAIFTFYLSTDRTRKSISSTLLEKKVIPNRKNFLDHLLVVRFCACALVISIHTLGNLAPDSHPGILSIFNMDFTWLIFTSGHAGVGMFFVLSGYLMGKGFFSNRYSLDRDGISKFYINRICRIVPLYFFSIIIVTVFAYPQLLLGSNFEIILKEILFSYNGQESINPNGALWTISTECQFYLLVPMFAIIINKMRFGIFFNIISIFSVMLVGFAIRYILWRSCHHNFQMWGALIYKPLYGNLDYFICGMLLVRIVNDNGAMRLIKSNAAALATSYSLVIALYLATSYWIWRMSTHYNESLVSSYVLLMPTFVIAFMLPIIYLIERRMSERLNGASNEALSIRSISGNRWRAFEILGILTFGIYIWQGDILVRIAPLLKPTPHFTSFLFLLFVCTGIIFFLASLSYIFIELPFERMKKSVKK